MGRLQFAQRLGPARRTIDLWTSHLLQYPHHAFKCHRVIVDHQNPMAGNGALINSQHPVLGGR